MKYLITFLMTATLYAQNANAVEKDTQAFLNALSASGGKAFETLPVAEARGVLEQAQADASMPKAEVTNKTITTTEGEISLTIVKPLNAGKLIPGFMYFHGGGWVLGDYKTHERLIRDLVTRSGAAAIYVDYARSPEVQFPIAMNQNYAATVWISENGESIGIDGSQLAVAGNSVGGNMATVVAIKAKEQKTPKLKFQLLLYPVTHATFDTESYNKYEEGYFLTRNMMKWFWDSYTTKSEERNSIYASPLNATIEQLSGLPPALIQTAENDVLRDEGELYAHKLDAAGVDVVSTRYNGMIHDFGLLNILSNVPTVQSSLDQAAGALKKHLFAD